MDMSGGKTDCISIQGDVPVLTDTVMKEGTSVKWYVLCTDSGREQGSGGADGKEDQP